MHQLSLRVQCNMYPKQKAIRLSDNSWENREISLKNGSIGQTGKFISVCPICQADGQKVFCPSHFSNGRTQKLCASSKICPFFKSVVRTNLCPIDSLSLSSWTNNSTNGIWKLSTTLIIKHSFTFLKKYPHSNTYFTSAAERASIQYTFDFFRLDPNAISCDIWQPSGNGGRFGIWPVQWAIANISGASLTSILPAGAERPGSYPR